MFRGGLNAPVPSLMVLDHTVVSVLTSIRDNLNGGGSSKKASKKPFNLVTAKVNFKSCTETNQYVNINIYIYM